MLLLGKHKREGVRKRTSDGRKRGSKDRDKFWEKWGGKLECEKQEEDLEKNIRGEKTHDRCRLLY